MDIRYIEKGEYLTIELRRDSCKNKEIIKKFV